MAPDFKGCMFTTFAVCDAGAWMIAEASAGGGGLVIGGDGDGGGSDSGGSDSSGGDASDHAQVTVQAGGTISVNAGGALHIGGGSQ